MGEGSAKSGGGGENNGCMLYNYLHSHSPDWGEEGGNEEQTRHVLCCKSSYLDEESDGKVHSAAENSVEVEESSAGGGGDSEQQQHQPIDPETILNQGVLDKPVDDALIAEEYPIRWHGIDR
jgi:hypothetical protein